MLSKYKSRKTLPPYVSYRTFRSFIDGLQLGIPARIDRTYWGERFSGSNGAQLMTALRFLGLIDLDGTPTSWLTQLVPATGSQRADILKQIAHSSYDFLIGKSVDPQVATYAQLERAFYDTCEVSGDVARKCIKFFIELGSEAGIPLSPLIIRKSKTMRVTGNRNGADAKVGNRTIRNKSVIPAAQHIPKQYLWYEMVLAKFPTFDPSWPDDVKLKWFESFKLLLGKETPPDTE
ncbi:hypothetical protein ACFLYX_00820 [Chloroflexota bacterium]